jgi:hypothetical protein
MAILHQAQLTPSKIDLLSAWIAAQPWLGGADASSLEAIGAYRFDDPDGEVGIETHLLRTADGQLLQVPVTYRAAPLPGGDADLVGTLQHSVLGQRWVYDGCADPVYVQALATAILTGGRQAELEIMVDGERRRREPTMLVWGSGSSAATPPRIQQETRDRGTSTEIRADGVELVVLHHINPGAIDDEGALTLTGTWPGQESRTLLALARSTLLSGRAAAPTQPLGTMRIYGWSYKFRQRRRTAARRDDRTFSASDSSSDARRTRVRRRRRHILHRPSNRARA